MNSFIRRSALGVFLSFTLAGSAGAYVFRIDTFEIDRNGVNFFTDNFNDGLPPPQAPGGSYSVSGTMGPENVAGNGKLVLDQSGAAFNLGLLGTTPNVSQNARFNSDITNANTTDGLKKNMVFSVDGVFDLIAPAVGDSYGIRLEDRVTAINGGLGSDIIDIRVRNVSGTPIIQFRDTDQLGNTQVLFELALELGHDQIILALDHPNANTNTIFGRYLYLDGGVDGALHSFVPTFNIFDGELFTRAGFLALHNIPTVVPEPGTLALLGFGLIGLLARSRRRAQH